MLAPHAMFTSVLVIASRSLLLVALVVAPVRSAGTGALVYVALGEPTHLGMQVEDPARIAEVLAGSGRRVRLVDLTAAGTTAGQIRRDQLQRVITLRPFLVTVAIGPTDACGTTTPQRFARDLEIVADLLHRNVPNVIVSTFAAPDERCGRTPRVLERRAETFNWILIRSAKRNRLSLADLGGGGAGTPRAWREVIAGKVALLFPRLSRAD